MRPRFVVACRLAEYVARQLGRDPASAHREAIMAHVNRLCVMGENKARTADFLARLADDIAPPVESASEAFLEAHRARVVELYGCYGRPDGTPTLLDLRPL